MSLKSAANESTKTRETLLIVLFILIALAPACVSKAALNHTNLTDSSADKKKAGEGKEIPAARNGYVISQTGTEKVKPAPGKANVQGKVLFNEKPAAGIEVKLCEKCDSLLFFNCSGRNYTTKTDRDGEYLFKNIEPREYEVLVVKVFNTPRYMFSAYTLFDFDLPRPNKYRIEVDKTFFAPATNLFKSDLKIQSPGKRAKVDPKTAEIKWEPYPDAAYYEVDLVNLREKGASYAKQGRVEGNIFKIDKPLTDGYYQLKTVAYNSNRVKLSEGTVNFTVISRAEPTTKTQSNINK